MVPTWIWATFGWFLGVVLVHNLHLGPGDMRVATGIWAWGGAITGALIGLSGQLSSIVRSSQIESASQAK
jgi:hypothetical protein